VEGVVALYQEPSDYENTDYELIIYEQDWTPAKTPVHYVEEDANFDSVFRNLGCTLISTTASEDSTMSLKPSYKRTPWLLPLDKPAQKPWS